MTNVNDLIAAIITALRSIPELAEALTGAGDEPTIYAHPLDPNTRSLAESIQGMTAPSAMVAFRGMALGLRGGIPQYQYAFSVILRAESEADQGPASPGYFTLLNLIAEGAPEVSGGARFSAAVIHPDFDPPEQITFTPLQDANGAEVWSLNFALTAVGG